MIKDRTHEYLADGRSWYQRNADTIKKITVHHTAGTTDGSEDFILNSIFSTHHGTNGWPGISYHYFYIPKRFKGYSGKIIKLNNDEDVTWHDGVNFDSIGFCIHGFYHPDVNQTLEPEDFENIKAFLDWLCSENPQFPADFDDVVGHRDRGQTACPGNYLYPYVTEYRTKRGNVDWGVDEDCLCLDDDITAGIEDEFKLKDKPWYSKYWNLTDFINDSIKTHSIVSTLEDTVSRQKTELRDLKTLLDRALTDKENINNTLIQTQKIHGDLKIAYDRDFKELTLKKEELTKLQTDYNKLNGLYQTALDKVDTYKGKLDLANLEIARLTNQKFTVPESLNFLIQAIRGGGKNVQ
jgi:hypothetical protein